jgi:hypothetical protein
MNMDPREAKRQELAAAMREFLAKGGKVQKLRRGESGEMGLTAAKRAQPTAVSAARRESLKADRDARRAQSTHAQDTHAAAGQRRPRKPSPPPAPRRKKSARERTWGVKSQRILEVLKSGPLASAQVATLIGSSALSARTQLWQMRKRGLVQSRGTHNSMRWELAA